MAICASGGKLLQEATGISRGRVYPVDKNDFKFNQSNQLRYLL